MSARYVLCIFFWDDQSFNARLFRAVSLFKDAADRANFALQRNFARNCHVLPNLFARDCAHQRRQNRRARARSVNVAAADNVYVNVEVVNIFTRRLSQNARRVEDRILCH